MSPRPYRGDRDDLLVKIGNGARRTKVAGSRARDKVRTAGDNVELWTALRDVSVNLGGRVTKLEQGILSAAGRNPYSPRFQSSVPAGTRVRSRLARKAARTAGNAVVKRSPKARKAKTAVAAAVLWKANPVAAVAKTVIVRPAQTFMSVLIILLIFAMLLWYVVIPAPMRGPLKWFGGMIVPSAYSCGTYSQPIGGVEGMAAFLGETTRKISDPEWYDGEKVRDGILQSFTLAGVAFERFRMSVNGAPTPTENVAPVNLPAAFGGPALAPSGAIAVGAVPVIAPAAGQEDLPLDAAGALQTSLWSNESDEVKQIAVAIASRESDDNPSVINPETYNGSKAHGLWQIMLPMHEDKFGVDWGKDWADPRSNANAAYRIYKDEGWEAWSVYKNGSYLERMDVAKQALAITSGANPNASSDPQQCAPGAPGMPGEPRVLQAGASGADAWGGQFENGQIPASALCAPSFTQGMLRCDAAAALEQMNVAYTASFGTPMIVTSTYRDYEGQVRCRAEKGSLCATPGTSNHGWGVAIDFGGGINRFGTPQHQWMVTNAALYGYVLPEWAQQGGSNPESWHWEYAAVGPTTSA